MFRNDYSELCAPEVLDAISREMGAQNVGYGLDRHSEEAEKKILKAFGLTKRQASVFFLAGGTQTNLTVISYLLRPYEAVIACDTGHINVHETGAVEGSGHKVLTVKNRDGKLNGDDIRRIVRLHRDEHQVRPAMVYISDTTETGTVYTAEELLDIRKACFEMGQLLFLDGARLGVALTAPGNDVTPEFLGTICDAFYVGGTKNGALLGEAVILKKGLCVRDFRYHIKNRGAMLAKGFLPGIMFSALFTDNLYFRLAENSNLTASLIRNGIKSCGIPLVGTSESNQIFIRVGKTLAGQLMDRYGCELWEDGETEQTVRIVTSFATREEDALELVLFLKNNF